MWSTAGCSCGALPTELEGVKLDLAIIQKSIDSGLISENEESSRDGDESLTSAMSVVP